MEIAKKKFSFSHCLAHPQWLSASRVIGCRAQLIISWEDSVSKVGEGGADTNEVYYWNTERGLWQWWQWHVVRMLKLAMAQAESQGWRPGEVWTKGTPHWKRPEHSLSCRKEDNRKHSKTKKQKQSNEQANRDSECTEQLSQCVSLPAFGTAEWWSWRISMSVLQSMVGRVRAVILGCAGLK